MLTTEEVAPGDAPQMVLPGKGEGSHLEGSLDCHYSLPEIPISLGVTTLEHWIPEHFTSIHAEKATPTSSPNTLDYKPVSIFKSSRPHPGARKTPLRRVDGQHILRECDIARRSPSPPVGNRQATSLPRSPEKDESCDEQHLLNPANLTLCITSYPYTADKNDELSFVEGQVIRVVRKVEGGWWEGQLDQRVGWFPANHVENYTVAPEDLADGEIGPFANTLEELDDLRVKTMLMNNEIQSVQCPSDANTDPETAKQEGYRIALAGSLIAAEKQYLESLQRFMDEFVYPLYQLDWFPPNDHQTIFGNIEDLVDFEKDLVEALESAAGGSQLFGQAFLSLSDRFSEVYNEYCGNLPNAMTVSTKYGQNSLMTRFLQTTSSNSTPPILHMVSFLHKPAQWKNKFSMALKNLLSGTDPQHADFESLSTACQRLDKILTSIEDRRKLIERRAMIRSLSGRIDGWEGPSLELYGDMVLEGNLKLQESVRKRERKFYLLEYVLVIARPLNNKTGDITFKLIEKLPLSRTVVLAVNDHVEGDAFNLSFQISYLTEESKARTLSITAFNPEQKEKWVAALNALLDRNIRAVFPISQSTGAEDMNASDGVEGKPGRSLKWFATWSAKIRKKRPSVPNLREYAESMVESDKDGDGNIFIRVIRKKETREKLKGSELSPTELDQASQTRNTHYPVPLPRASIISNAEMALPHHAADEPGDVGPLSGAMDSQRTPPRERLSGGSSRSWKTSSLAIPSPDEALAQAILEPPPPMPPLPSIVKESIRRRSRAHSGSSSGSATTLTTAVMNSLRLSMSSPSVNAVKQPSSPVKLTIATTDLGSSGPHELERAHTPVSATNSESSSPASFLWMHTPRSSIGNRLRPPTPGPESAGSVGMSKHLQGHLPLISNPAHHTLSRDSFKESILAPLANAPTVASLEPLENRTNIQPRWDGKTTVSSMGRRQRILSHPPVLEGSSLSETELVEWQKFISYHSDTGESTSDEIRGEVSVSAQPVATVAETKSRRASLDRMSLKSQSQQSTSTSTITGHRSVVPTAPPPSPVRENGNHGQVSASGSDSFTRQRQQSEGGGDGMRYGVIGARLGRQYQSSEDSSSFVTSHRGSSSVQLPHYEEGETSSNRRFPYHLPSSLSMADLPSLNKSPQRKSSSSNLVQVVRGSIDSLFRRSRSSDALKAGKMKADSSSESVRLKQESRKSSFADLKGLLTKARRRSKSAGNEQGLAGASKTTVVSSMQVPSPVVLQQPYMSPSPPRSVRVSGESVQPGKTRPYTPSVQSVPFPSPLPSAPLTSASAATSSTGAPKRSLANVAAPPEEGAVEDGRRGLDSGVYGLLSAEGSRAQEPMEPVPPIPDIYSKNGQTANLEKEMDAVPPPPPEKDFIPVVAVPPREEASGSEKVTSLLRDEISVPPSPSRAERAKRQTIFETLKNRFGGEAGTSINNGTTSPPTSFPHWIASTESTSSRLSVRLRSKSSGAPPAYEHHTPDDTQESGDQTSTANPTRVLRRARSNLAGLNSDNANSLKRAMENSAPRNGLRLGRLASVENFCASKSTREGLDSLPTPEDEEEEYGPVIGRLEKAWYADLVNKCEAMATEIRQLKNQLKAVEAKVGTEESEKASPVGVCVGRDGPV
ncbi:uncharacterized protein SPPG_07697 [Spizellomyces punctatus DAOM BR117]|uniref:DH domain-containing protein n=1 Tax=Spizellomyces punctatus (strain DAOM BR117) TaxID=645134 RepID=A0A0L0H5S3_SPIPD|nr:uncharacterized protein SPPG_07697 [Spizellomyces punctatus DAOM BR117]KNC96865.1 hypothetical protein SPPG_07697 [Spizellomyces punctatus DAOM BR117]|eukprot:XP_016604905.1 hypothetical protein SPPG_07697 [Spizellomyces punctatus DAOM BR117]